MDYNLTLDSLRESIRQIEISNIDRELDAFLSDHWEITCILMHGGIVIAGPDMVAKLRMLNLPSNVIIHVSKHIRTDDAYAVKLPDLKLSPETSPRSIR